MNVSPAAYHYPFGSFSTVASVYPGVSSDVSGATPAEKNRLNPVVNPVSAGPNSPENIPADENTPKAQINSAEEIINGHALDQNDLRLLDELQKTDADVRRHEMAHVAAGGKYITSGANFTYQKGPDGKNYAVGGEVGIDTSPVPGDPQATLQKMRQVKAAALAPANPSSQDRKVASNATAEASKALSELMMLQAKTHAQNNEAQAFGGLKKAADTYTRINTLPEKGTSSFEIAV